MTDTTPVIIESQLDYLTCAVHTSRKVEKLELLAEAWAKTSEQPANRVTPWRLMGYEGWRCGRVSYGHRYGAALLQLSGDLARLHFDTLAVLWDSVSRIDMAVTIKLSRPDDMLGRLHYDQASQHYAQRPRAARPSYHGDADGGFTCYLGDRTSDRYFRIYNKHAESLPDPVMAEHYFGCWRYELESKGQTAGALADYLSKQPVERRAATVQDLVHDYLSRHGITPPFPAQGGTQLQGGFRRRSDRESRLAWLQRTVRPSIEWLAASGMLSDVYEALGLMPIFPKSESDDDDEQPGGPNGGATTDDQP